MAQGRAAYLMMELVPSGHTLKPYTRRDKLMPVENMLEIGAANAEALDAAHSHAAVHREWHFTQNTIRQARREQAKAFVVRARRPR